jgi:hypothetical protein
MKRILTLLLLASVGSVLLGGCTSAEPTATKNEEDAFRNPPKNPPAGLEPKGPPAGVQGGG